MLIQTHKAFANILLEEIKRDLDIEIDSNYFIYGNILPDIAPKYVSQKHFLDNSLFMIIDKTNHLMKVNTITSRKFSVELGIITHYLCDFFCEPHNNRTYFKSKINKHIIYEKNLHASIDHNINLYQLSEFIAPNETLDAFILKMVKKYNSLSPSFERDILYSLFVAKSVSIHIIKHSVFYLSYLENYKKNSNF